MYKELFGSSTFKMCWGSAYISIVEAVSDGIDSLLEQQ